MSAEDDRAQALAEEFRETYGDEFTIATNAQSNSLTVTDRNLGNDQDINAAYAALQGLMQKYDLEQTGQAFFGQPGEAYERQVKVGYAEASPTEAVAPGDTPVNLGTPTQRQV